MSDPVADVELLVRPGAVETMNPDPDIVLDLYLIHI